MTRLEQIRDHKQQLVRRLLDRWRTDIPLIRVTWDVPDTDGHPAVMPMSRSSLLYNSRMGYGAKGNKHGQD